ncbi:MAG: hypothetical protein IT285_04460 [Bdellovibrionales bacterium]|nr:hypothetical protein [Bdellovibrionales bacterium]
MMTSAGVARKTSAQVACLSLLLRGLMLGACKPEATGGDDDDLTGNWTALSCSWGASSLNGAIKHRSQFTFSGGTNFSYTQVWYSGADCDTGTEVAELTVSGTYTVGDCFGRVCDEDNFIVPPSSISARGRSYLRALCRQNPLASEMSRTSRALGRGVRCRVS